MIVLSLHMLYCVGIWKICLRQARPSQVSPSWLEYGKQHEATVVPKSNSEEHMDMDQYLLIPFLVGWTSIYQLFWCSPGVPGFDTQPYVYTWDVFLMMMERHPFWLRHAVRKHGIRKSDWPVPSFNSQPIGRIYCSSRWVNGDYLPVNRCIPMHFLYLSVSPPQFITGRKTMKSNVTKLGCCQK